MRTASTWTYQCLSLHPDVEFPAGKQIHFLDTHLDRGLAWYRSLFADTAGKFGGDITPAYATVGDAEVELFADAFGDLRVFFVVRDPIERAWSSARLSIKRDELDPAALDTDWYIRRLTRRSVQIRNAYATTYSRWKAHFGDRFWLADFAGLAADPQGFLVALCTHIGIDPTVFARPSDEVARAIASQLNATPGLDIGAHVDKTAIDAAVAATYRAEVSWYLDAPVDWPVR